MGRDRQAKEIEQLVGLRLRLARERQGRSLKDLERASTIHAHHLEALERGNFEALPNRGWARGFLVSYANHLGFEGEALAEEVFPRQHRSRPTRYIERHWRGIATVLGSVAIAVLIAFASTIIAPYNTVTEKITDALNRIAPGLLLENSPQRIVVIGLAEGEAVGEGNVLVAKIAQDGLGLLSIPNNTLVEMPGRGAGAIGDAARQGRPDLARSAVARLTGVEVQHYLVIGPEGIKEIVDAMGGVRIDVPGPVSGRARPGGPVLTLRPGPQALSGEQALVYLQGRDLLHVAERAERQQVFLSTMFRQALGPSNLLSDPATLDSVREHTQSSMSPIETLQLVGRVRALKDSGAGLEAATVPGREGASRSGREDAKSSYWIPDARKLPAVLKETVR